MVILAVPCTAAPSVSGMTAPEKAGLYEKFEIAFNVSTAATQLYWPYDTSPNPGVEAGVGVSIDGLFSNDNWQTTIVQPGFYYQPYYSYPGNPNQKIDGGTTWAYPSGNPGWRIRFAPKATGSWKYKIRVKDSSGTTTSSEYSFTVVPSSNHGFVGVSPNDGRYFELSDGTYLPLIGITDVECTKYSQLAQMGVNFVRSWWQSSNTPLALFGAGGQGGDCQISNLWYSTVAVRPGHLVSAQIPNVTSWQTCWETINTFVPVKSNTKYRFSAWVKTVGVTGSGEYGIYLSEYTSMRKSAPLNGTNDWTKMTVDIDSGDHIALRLLIGGFNVTGGNGYLSDWSLKEDIGNGNYGPELLPRPDLQSHTNYSQLIAWSIDHLLDAALANGIYVRAVIEEKGDSFFSRIQSDGTWGAQSDSNIYATSTHACRTYQQYYWRYLIARYGYSTALHSFELVNEGDPHNTFHHDAVAALGDYVQKNDPNRHLVSSSNWHSFPPVMWKNPSVGTADLHMYIGYRIASGGNRIWPGWDGDWAMMNDNTTMGNDYSIDTSVAHTGKNSLKINVPPISGDDGNRISFSNAWFNCGTPLGHQLKFSMWVKGEKLTAYNGKSWISPAGIHLQFSQGGGDFAGYPWGTGTTEAPWGTYDWKKLEFTMTVPSSVFEGSDGHLPLMMMVQPFSRANNSATSGTVWIDDFVVEDLTTGKVINYNGSFEYMDSESYDVVACHSAYSRLTDSYDLGKPVIRGEIGFCYPQRFPSPYKGWTWEGSDTMSGQDQLLVDDTDGIWWKKWVWANTDWGGLTEVYWWPNLPIARNYKYGRAYLTFIAGEPVSNGKYKDCQAQVSNAALRVLGQKDTTNNRAYLWIDNAPYTWKNVVDKVAIPQASGTVTVSGFKDGSYQVEWWDTTTGTITRTDKAQCTNGNVVLSVQNLQSDVACKVYQAPADISLQVTVPMTDVFPGQTVNISVAFINNGESSSYNTSVSTKVPSEMEYVPGSAEASGGVWDADTQTVTWVVDQIDAHQSGTRAFKAKVR
ncbi:MAG: hypothetical protein ABFD54_15680 [Armatimonadota bacterium]